MTTFSALHFIDTFQHIGIVYEDNHLLVIHKPRNTPVQKDISEDESIQEKLQAYLKQKYNKPGNVFVGIVHRLDRPVSGLMVFAKTSKAASRLSEQLRNKSLKKKYLACLEGHINDSGTLTDFLLKNEKNNTVSVVAKNQNGALEAILHYKKVYQNQRNSFVYIELETGRPHQIRVQFSSRGYPIVGDAKYGSNQQQRSNIELKSVGLEFEHPTTKEQLLFSGFVADSPIWKDFLEKI